MAKKAALTNPTLLRKPKIYLDYAASTPLCPEALSSTQKTLKRTFGNPGSIHSFGQEAISLLDQARQNFSKTLGVGFRDVIFTASATEANNLAVRGIAEEYRKTNPTGGRVIISAIEHDSVGIPARALSHMGFEVIEIKPNKQGVISVSDVAASLTFDTILVSVMLGNNEIGTLQPLPKISSLIREFKSSQSLTKGPEQNQKAACRWPLLHSDASQCLQFMDCSPQATGADLITLSSQKIYGPKGAGALILPEKFRGLISPLITGGHQEWGLRAGTENVPTIAGFSAALSYVYTDREKEAIHIAKLRHQLWFGIKKIFPRALINGIPPVSKTQLANGDSLPHILNIRFPGIPSDELITALDMQGVAVSAGAACAMRSPDPSSTLLAMGLSEQAAKESIRFSLGRPTTTKEIGAVLLALKKILSAFQK